MKALQAAVFFAMALGVTANIVAAPPTQNVNVVNIPLPVTVENPVSEVTIVNDPANPVPVSVQGGCGDVPQSFYVGTLAPQQELTIFTVPPDKIYSVTRLYFGFGIDTIGILELRSSAGTKSLFRPTPDEGKNIDLGAGVAFGAGEDVTLVSGNTTGDMQAITIVGLLTCTFSP